MLNDKENDDSFIARGYKPSFPMFDEAGDPRLMSETQKQDMIKNFNDAKPKTDENTKRND